LAAVFVIAACLAGFFAGPIGAAVAVGAALLVLLIHGLGQRARASLGNEGQWAALRPSVAPIVAEPEAAEPQPEVQDQPGARPRYYDGMLAWVLVACVLRMAFVVLLNASPLWRAFAPDAIGWEDYGRQMLDYWSGATAYPERWLLEINTRTFYAALNAMSLWLLDTARYPLSILNAFVGIGAAAVMGRLAEEVWDGAVGKRTFLICLFFPSMMTWTCMSIREAWAYLALAMLLLGVQQLRNRVALMPIVLVVIALPAIYTLRSYLLPLLLAAVAMSFFVVRLRQLPYALLALTVLGVLVVAFGDQVGVTTELVSESQLEEVHRLRNGLAYGGSAYGTEVDTRTWAGTVAYLPEGVARFLFAPFPWSIRSWRQALTLPESLMWFVLFYQAVQGVLHGVRQRLASVVTPLFACVLVTLAYAVVSGNEGTAYRHRAQVMIVLFMFSAAHQVRKKAGIRSSERAAQPTARALPAPLPQVQR